MISLTENPEKLVYIVVGTIEQNFSIRAVTYRYTDNSTTNKLVPDILSDIAAHVRKEGWDFKPLTIIHKDKVLWSIAA